MHTLRLAARRLFVLLPTFCRPRRRRRQQLSCLRPRPPVASWAAVGGELVSQSECGLRTLPCSFSSVPPPNLLKLNPRGIGAELQSINLAFYIVLFWKLLKRPFLPEHFIPLSVHHEWASYEMSRSQFSTQTRYLVKEKFCRNFGSRPE